MKSKIIASAAITFYSLLFAFCPTPAQAGTETLKLSPAFNYHSFSAGDQTGGEVTVTNSGDTAFSFRVYASDYWVQGEAYEPVFTDNKINSSAADWFSFNKTQYTLAPGEKVNVSYKINAPKSVGPGGYYAAIFIETQPLAGGISRQKRVGSLLYLTVSGSTSKSGKLLSWQVPFWQTKPPLQAVARLQNNGNVHYEANGVITVSDLFGRTKTSMAVSGVVLPGTTRRIDAEWEQAPRFGLLKVSGHIRALDQNYVLAPKLVFMLTPEMAFILLALVGGLVYNLWKYGKRHAAS